MFYQNCIRHPLYSESLMLRGILDLYGLTGDTVTVTPFGTGLVNHTWLVSAGKGKFILQRINDGIFKNPTDIAHNIRLIGEYLSEHYPGYLFVMPEKTTAHEDMVHLPAQGYFRLFPFVKDSHAVEVVHTTQQAYGAARQFGRFSKLLSGFRAEKLHITLPGFHNLTMRYAQFEKALQKGNPLRIGESAETIRYLQSQRNIAMTYENVCANSSFRKRVTHHDTKISNVLFDGHDNAICVIDLDTIMPGHFISDVGDMMRTYLCPVSEEEQNLDLVEIREDYFKAIADGYLGEMAGELTATERSHFVYAGKCMVYMQALRFLTDYLNNDVYYGSKYEGHNLVRAKNQTALLQKLIAKEALLSALV